MPLARPHRSSLTPQLGSVLERQMKWAVTVVITIYIGASVLYGLGMLTIWILGL
jgi:hypothetical protein